jgi:AraC family transcriptional regulator of adaptative response / DNA-3-methyladenine glycosylase II
LFTRHLNATPMQAAKTARVQRAKRLLDQTDLPMTEVAFRAGFRSLRRFNAVFVEVYQRSPSEVRRFARASGRGPHAIPKMIEYGGMIGDQWQGRLVADS